MRIFLILIHTPFVLLGSRDRAFVIIIFDELVSLPGQEEEYQLMSTAQLIPRMVMEQDHPHWLHIRIPLIQNRLRSSAARDQLLPAFFQNPFEFDCYTVPL